MPAQLRRLLPVVRRERGVTIIEMVVVCLILGIVGTASMMLMISIFDSQIRASQYLDQQTTIESYYGFLASRLATTQKGKVGLPYCKPASGQSANSVCQEGGHPQDRRVNNECKPDEEANGNCQTIIDPLTIAGDQLVFQSGDFCYRVFHIDTVEQFPNEPERQLQQIRASVSTNCNDIAPQRGPSEQSGPEDPVLDELYGRTAYTGRSFPLANRIIPDRPAYASSDAPNPLEAFRYYGAADDTSEVPQGIFAPDDGVAVKAKAADRNKAPNQLPLLYREAANRGQVAFVKGFAYISPVDPGSKLARVSDRPYSQVFSLAQVCDVPATGGGGGGGGGGGLVPGTLLLSETIRSNSTDENDWYSSGGTVSLPSGQLASGPIAGEAVPMILDFKAQVQLRAKAGGSQQTSYAVARVSVVLERRQGGGSWAETQDDFGQSRVSRKVFLVRRAVANLGTLGSPVYENEAGEAVAISDAFHLPASSDPQNEQWRLRVEVEVVGGNSGVEHMVHRDYTFLTLKQKVAL